MIFQRPKGNQSGYKMCPKLIVAMSACSFHTAKHSVPLHKDHLQTGKWYQVSYQTQLLMSDIFLGVGPVDYRAKKRSHTSCWQREPLIRRHRRPWFCHRTKCHFFLYINVLLAWLKTPPPRETNMSQGLKLISGRFVNTVWHFSESCQ